MVRPSGRTVFLCGFIIKPDEISNLMELSNWTEKDSHDMLSYEWIRQFESYYQYTDKSVERKSHADGTGSYQCH